MTRGCEVTYMNHKSDGWRKSSIPRSKHLFHNTVYNYLYAASDLVRALDLNNKVEAFVHKLLRKEYLVSSKTALC